MSVFTFMWLSSIVTFFSPPSLLIFLHCIWRSHFIQLHLASEEAVLGCLMFKRVVAPASEMGKT